MRTVLRWMRRCRFLFRSDVWLWGLGSWCCDMTRTKAKESRMHMLLLQSFDFRDDALHRMQPPAYYDKILQYYSRFPTPQSTCDRALSYRRVRPSPSTTHVRP